MYVIVRLKQQFYGRASPVGGILIVHNIFLSKKAGMDDFKRAVAIYQAVAEACEGGHPSMCEREYQQMLLAHYRLSEDERKQVSVPPRMRLTLGQDAYATAFTAQMKLYDALKK